MGSRQQHWVPRGLASVAVASVAHLDWDVLVSWGIVASAAACSLHSNKTWTFSGYAGYEGVET